MPMPVRLASLVPVLSGLGLSSGDGPAGSPPARWMTWLDDGRRAVVAVETIDRLRGPLEGILPALPGQGGTERGSGAGFRLEGEGWIVTSAHVVQDASRIRIRDGDGAWWPASVRGMDTDSDLALLHAPGSGTACLGLSEGGTPRIGEWVVAIGNPLGLQGSVTVGIVSAVDRVLPIAGRIGFIQTDAVLQPGSSGGPLLDGTGRVIGVNAAVARHMPGLGFAVPSRVARWVLPRLAAAGGIRRGRLPLRFLPEPDDATWGGPGQAAGLRVVEPGAGSLASEAGIRKGDRLLAVEGVPVHVPLDVERALLCHEVGDAVALSMSRAGRPERVILRLDGDPGGDGLRGRIPADRPPVAGP